MTIPTLSIKTLRAAIENPSCTRIYGVITPETSEWFLTNYGKPGNRGGDEKNLYGIDRRVLKPLAELMASDVWMPEFFQPIVVSSTGVLINGHTRLSASSVYEVSIEVVIAFGAPDYVYKYMDPLGAGTRTHRQRLGEHGVTAPDKYRSALRWIPGLIRGNIDFKDPQTVLTGFQLLDSYDETWRKCYDTFRDPALAIYRVYLDRRGYMRALHAAQVMALIMATAGPEYNKELWQRVKDIMEDWRKVRRMSPLATATKVVSKRAAKAAALGTNLRGGARLEILVAGMNAALENRPVSETSLGRVAQEGEKAPVLLRPWK